MPTLSDLVSKELTADLEWREAEMAVVRKQLYLSPHNSLLEQALLRSATAMVYAHYEGFCKFALEVYIDSLERLKLRRAELIWTLAAFSMKKYHSDLKNHTDSNNFFSDLLSNFNDSLNDYAVYEKPPQIANLWPDLLASWLTKLGLSADYVMAEQKILGSLVNNRNQIAHGKKLIVKTREELDKYAGVATLAMHEVAIGIVTALESHSYKRTAPGQTILSQAN